MSVSANIPALGNKITKDVPDQNALNQRMMRCDFSDVTDLPVGTKALVESAEGWEVRQFNGTGWVLLEKWNIDAQKVDGHSASTGTTANTIPVRDANGKLPGDITGNAATASKASALSATNPIATGGTGATTAEQARENLVVPPKSHASSSTEYGAGSSTQYGHLKSHDAPDATKTAATGHAFSPAGAAAMQETLEGQIGDLAGVVSGNAAAQSAKDAAQDAAIAGKLSTSGGTMTGILFRDGPLVRGVTNNGEISFGAGIEYKKGGDITLFGVNHDNANLAGGVLLRGYNASGNVLDFLVKADSVTVNNNAILTSAGGEVGMLIYNSTVLARNNNTAGLNICGGSGINSGGRIVAFGLEHPVTPGEVHFYTPNANGTLKAFKATPAGGLTWISNPVLTLVASWDGGGDWYRKYSDGWIEQGGIISVSTTEKTYPLHLPMKCNMYPIGQVIGHSEYACSVTIRITEEDGNTSFKARSNGNYTVQWYCTGMEV